MSATPSEPAGSGPAAGASVPDARQTRDDQAAWGAASTGEPRWPPLLAVVVAIALQIVLPNRLIQGLGPRWLVPALEGVLLVALLITNPHRWIARSRICASCPWP